MNLAEFSARTMLRRPDVDRLRLPTVAERGEFTRVRNANPIPRFVAQLVWARARRDGQGGFGEPRCERCKKSGVALALHHLRYFKPIGEDPYAPKRDTGPWGENLIFGREWPRDLMALCGECHDLQHFDVFDEFHVDPADTADANRC